MSLPLYLSSLKLSRTALFTWAVILLASAFLVALLYDSLKDLTGLQELISGLPEGMRSAFGLADLEGAFVGGVMDIRYFLNARYLNWVPLMLAIYAVFYCGGIVSREAERGTLDLLLSQPLPRYKLVISKMATFLSIAAILLVLSWMGMLAGLATIGVSADVGRLAIAHALTLPLVMGVAGYSALISCLYLDPRRSLAAAGGVTAAMYVLNIMGPALGGVRWLQNLSLFHHVDLLSVLLDGAVDWTGLAVNLAVALVALSAALVVFEHRDLIY